MEEFFDPEIFTIEEDEDGYIISTKDGKQCLNILLKRNTITITKLEKCGSNGTFLLKRLEEYARSIDIYEINLQDESEIIINCVNGEEIIIDLASLKLLTTGQSWYNSLGYVSYSNAEEIAMLPCMDAIEKSKEKKIHEIREKYSLECLTRKFARYSKFKKTPTSVIIKFQIDNNESFIASKIHEVEAKTQAIIYHAGLLFPHQDLSLSVRDYLLSILPEKFVEGGNCQEYKFIRDFINFISILLNYEKFLKKSLTGGRKRLLTKYGFRYKAKGLKSKKLRK